MRILVVSDTHRRNERLYNVLDLNGPFDGLIHLGDIEGSETEIEAYANCPCYMVAGNNDFFSPLPSEKEITLGKYHILLTHGHYYYVGSGIGELIRQGKSRGYDIVMYGHTHRPIIAEEDGVIICNPGSLTHPRQEGKQASYIIMEIGKDDIAHFEIYYI